jgi:uncharacterized repeat protein (TIGR04076 family)
MSDTFDLYDLRVRIEEIRGRCTCDHRVGDSFELLGGKLHLPAGQSYCLYALQATIPLLPAKQRNTHPNDWMSTDARVVCPDPLCGVVMLIERTRQRTLHHAEVSASDLPAGPLEQRMEQGARQNISSGTPWEALAGYSRAVRFGNLVFVAGTTASDEHGALQGGEDPYAQTHYILRKIEVALQQAGAGLADVVRTRVYVARLEDWREVARAHGEVFGTIRPANTLVQVAGLVDGRLVEIEADAVIRQ